MFLSKSDVVGNLGINLLISHQQFFGQPMKLRVSTHLTFASHTIGKTKFDMIDGNRWLFSQ